MILIFGIWMVFEDHEEEVAVGDDILNGCVMFNEDIYQTLDEDEDYDDE